MSRPTDTQLQLLNCISHQDDQLDTKSDSTNKISAEICSALDMEGRGGPTVGRRYLRVREPPGLSLPPRLADLIEFGDRRRADGRLPMGPTRYALLHNSSSQVGSRDFTIRLGPAGSLASLKLTCSRPKTCNHDQCACQLSRPAKMWKMVVDLPVPGGPCAETSETSPDRDTAAAAAGAASRPGLDLLHGISQALDGCTLRRVHLASTSLASALLLISGRWLGSCRRCCDSSRWWGAAFALPRGLHQRL